MMYYVNKIVGFATNPLSVGLLLVFVGLVAWRWRKVAYAAFVLAFVWLWVWSTPATCRWTGLALERPWLDANGRVPAAESFPTVDAIVLLSGGMCANTNVSDYGEICPGGDRARFAAALYRAGKAPRVVLTGLESRQSTVPFLRELGVPESAMVIDNDSMNTEENALFTSRLLGGGKAKILLVTSAYHMRRSVLMFRKYAPELEIVPAASDFEVLSTCQKPMGPGCFLPEPGSIGRNTIHIKEFVGYWGYKLLR